MSQNEASFCEDEYFGVNEKFCQSSLNSVVSCVCVSLLL